MIFFFFLKKNCLIIMVCNAVCAAGRKTSVMEVQLQRYQKKNNNKIKGKQNRKKLKRKIQLLISPFCTPRSNNSSIKCSWTFLGRSSISGERKRNISRLCHLMYSPCTAIYQHSKKQERRKESEPIITGSHHFSWLHR